MVSLSVGNSLTFEPVTLTISAPSTNSDPVVVLIEGTEFSFGPDESKTIVEIDIKPGSDPNSINCNNNNGTIPVAILSTDDFDATTIDHTTVAFEGASERHVNKKSGEARRHEEDVDDDGDTDLVFHFRFGDTDLMCESTEGLLTGETFDGQAIEGSDAINTVGANKARAVAEEAAVPQGYALYHNYPNPFNPVTTIRFDLPESAQVRLVIYDVLGRQVRVLVDGVREAGMHEVVFKAGALPSGTYLVRLEMPQGSFMQMMQLVK